MGEEVDMDRFLQVRKGDMFCVKFQYNHCCFVNLKKRETVQFIISDTVLLGYITRRVNLDMFWSKYNSMVYSNSFNMIEEKKESEELKLVSIATACSLWPINDLQGFQVTLEMIKQSQFPGKNNENYQQFDSIRN